MTPDEFLSDKPLPKKLFATVRQEVEALGGTSLRVTKSQIAFRRRRNFAWVWMPGQYLKGKVAPLVLTVALPFRDKSPRWKEIVEPVPGRFTHHLELNDPADIDEDVRNWLRQAWEAAG
jgi:predicted transport protein